MLCFNEGLFIKTANWLNLAHKLEYKNSQCTLSCNSTIPASYWYTFHLFKANFNERAMFVLKKIPS